MLTKTPNGEQVIFFYTLLDDGKASKYQLNKDTIASNAPRFVIKSESKKDKGIFYDKQNDRIYQFYPIFGKDFYVKDDSLSNRFQWTIVDSTKEIMSYKCKMAKSVFRGRNYIVYFTDALPFFTGPWKLQGLPGVILEAKTDDNRFEFSAYRISLLNTDNNFSNPYADENIEYLTFREHKQLLLKKMIDLQKKAQAKEKDEDVQYTFKDNSIELLN